MKEGTKMKIKNKHLKFNASKLNSLYLGKEMVYNGTGHSLKPYRGEIINIAYYSNLDGPYCEVRLQIWNNKTKTKIMKLSDVVLALASSKKSKVA